MTDTYRSRTRAVRGAARDHLRQLRADRLSRRGARPAETPEAQAPTGASVSAAEPSLSISAAAESACIRVSAAEAGEPEWTDNAADEVRASSVAETLDGAARESAASDRRLRADPDREVTCAEPPADGGEIADGRSDPVERAPNGMARDPGCRREAKTESQDMPAVPAGSDDEERAGSATTTDDAAARTEDHATTGPGHAAEVADGSAFGNRAHDGAAGGGGSDGPTGDTTDAGESDLHMLPGAGPGLVWMLQRCGVTSLDDLAQADPEVLTDQMGLIGQMLDLSSWVAFADRVGTER
jgi:predicted flap endonuclease-1-like 5' DNA nuclease